MFSEWRHTVGDGDDDERDESKSQASFEVEPRALTDSERLDTVRQLLCRVGQVPGSLISVDYDGFVG